MDSSSPAKLDWNLVQAFLAVVEHGAVARGAQAIGSTQPTLSRQIAALEAEIGAALFTRGARGSLLTAAGAALVEPARQMQAAAHLLQMAASGQRQSLRGTVRISASEVMCVHFLPAMLTPLRVAQPEIQIELVANDALDNLLERKADIAVRMVRPTQDSLVARHLGDLGLGGYASRAYIERKGVEFSPATLALHDWVGHDKRDVILRGMRALGLPLTRESFAVRSDSEIVCWQAVLDGMGIGFGLDLLAARHGDVVRVLPAQWIPDIPVWLTSPQELRSNPRVRLVFDHLATHLTPLTHGPAGAPTPGTDGSSR